jgi:hypothetical protein
LSIGTRADRGVTDLSNALSAGPQQQTTKRKQQNMMNHTDGWMGGWTGGGMWIWAVIGVAVLVLLVVAIGKLSKK